MNKTIINNIKDSYNQFSDTNKVIADVLLENEDDKLTLTVRDYAKLAMCAPSTILKFVQKIGFDSYSIFKYEVNQVDYEFELKIESSFNLVHNYIYKNQEIFTKLISEIKNARKVFFFASGQSRLAPLDFVSKANKQESHKYTFEVQSAYQYRLVNFINEDDLIIFVSNSGRAKELISILPTLPSNNVFLITNRENSPLARRIDNVINLNNRIEAETSFKEFSQESKYSLIYFMDLVYNTTYLHN